MGGRTTERNRNDSAKERGMSEREKDQRDRYFDKQEEKQRDTDRKWG